MTQRLWGFLGLFSFTCLVILALHLVGMKHSSVEHSHALTQYPSLYLFFVIGLVGSGHCIGMCGPFVMGYTHSKRNHWSAHVLYGLGRSTTYGLMGLFAGVFGTALQSLIGVRALLLVAAGVLMIYLALAELKLFPRHLPSIQNWRTYRKTVDWLFRREQWYRTYPLGLVLGFIPCGLTAIALSLALTQSPLIATLGMFLFGLGTMPAMVGFGLLIQKLKFPRLQRYTAWLMVIFGSLTIWLGVYRLGWLPPPPQMALLHKLHPTSLPVSTPDHSDHQPPSIEHHH